MRISTFVLVIGLIGLAVSASAQTKPASKSTVTTFPKIKPPKLHTSLGGFKDTSSVPVATAQNIISQKIRIYDDKNVEYGISSYQFLYRKIGVAPDESGKNVPITTISTDRFKVSPLPELWVNLVKEQLKAGEEFYFFEVIAKDAQGRVMYAPDLKILIK